METLEPILHIEYKNWVKLQSHNPIKFLSYRQWLEKEVIELRAQDKTWKENQDIRNDRMRIVSCMDCPCICSDSDYGVSCNLGYPVKQKAEIVFGFRHTRHYSEECKLMEIRTHDRNISPKEIEKEDA